MTVGIVIKIFLNSVYITSVIRKNVTNNVDNTKKIMVKSFNIKTTCTISMYLMLFTFF